MNLITPVIKLYTNYRYQVLRPSLCHDDDGPLSCAPSGCW